MPIRRSADPSSVQLVLDAVRFTVSQKQQADLPKLCKYMQRVKELTQAQAELYIKQTLQDGLVVGVHKAGFKSGQKGMTAESYKIPTAELENPADDGHDWYCIECHLGGDVIPCRTCHRVFHPECATNAVQKKLVNNVSILTRLSSTPKKQTTPAAHRHHHHQQASSKTVTPSPSSSSALTVEAEPEEGNKNCATENAKTENTSSAEPVAVIDSTPEKLGDGDNDDKNSCVNLTQEDGNGADGDDKKNVTSVSDNQTPPSIDNNSTKDEDSKDTKEKDQDSNSNSAPELMTVQENDDLKNNEKKQKDVKQPTLTSNEDAKEEPKNEQQVTGTTTKSEEKEAAPTKVEAKEEERSKTPVDLNETLDDKSGADSSAVSLNSSSVINLINDSDDMEVMLTEAISSSHSAAAATTTKPDPETDESENNNSVKDQQDNADGYNYEVCSVCNLLKNNSEEILSPDELNYLLNFTLNRIKSWLPASITDTMSPEPKHEWLTEQEINWRSRQLIYQPMDVPLMELKIRTNEYSTLTQFHVDILTIQHNVAIYHGIESQEYGASEFMLQDCCYDLNEIKQCSDCYRHSNEKTSSRWFCVPCRIPHELVWAKQKGYPYWPAKVIRRMPDTCDVRFFGAKHLRAVIPNSSIKPVDTKLSAMQIKRTTAFNKAYEELTLHQRLLKNPDEVKMLVHSKPKSARPAVPRASSKPRKNSTASQQLQQQKEQQKEQQQQSDSKTTGRKRRSTASANKDIYEFNDSSFNDDEASFSGTPSATTTSNGAGSSGPGRKRKQSASATAASSSSKVDKNATPTTPRRGRPKDKNKKQKMNDDADVIDISNGDGQDYDNGYMENGSSFNYQRGYDGSQELVSSSTEHIRMQPTGFDSNPSRRNSNGSALQLDRPYSDAVEKMRRQMEIQVDRNAMIKIAMDCMQMETDRLTDIHSEQIRNMFEAHNTQLSETKKKQWCYNCEQEAIYHCCWNTAYCSTACQQQHWNSEHKKVCRRKRC